MNRRCEWSHAKPAHRRVQGETRRPAGARDTGLGVLLFIVVASSIAGSETVFTMTLIFTWLLLPALVGFRNTLDAGCAFMIVALGVAVVTGLARSGTGLPSP